MSRASRVARQEDVSVVDADDLEKVLTLVRRDDALPMPGGHGVELGPASCRGARRSQFSLTQRAEALSLLRRGQKEENEQISVGLIKTFISHSELAWKRWLEQGRTGHGLGGLTARRLVAYSIAANIFRIRSDHGLQTYKDLLSTADGKQFALVLGKSACQPIQPTDPLLSLATVELCRPGALFPTWPGTSSWEPLRIDKYTNKEIKAATARWCMLRKADGAPLRNEEVLMCSAAARLAMPAVVPNATQQADAYGERTQGAERDLAVFPGSRVPGLSFLGAVPERDTTEAPRVSRLLPELLDTNSRLRVRLLAVHYLRELHHWLAMEPVFRKPASGGSLYEGLLPDAFDSASLRHPTQRSQLADALRDAIQSAEPLLLDLKAKEPWDPWCWWDGLAEDSAVLEEALFGSDGAFVHSLAQSRTAQVNASNRANVARREEIKGRHMRLDPAWHFASLARHKDWIEPDQIASAVGPQHKDDFHLVANWAFLSAESMLDPLHATSREWPLKRFDKLEGHMRNFYHSPTFQDADMGRSAIKSPDYEWRYRVHLGYFKQMSTAVSRSSTSSRFQSRLSALLKPKAVDHESRPSTHDER